MSEMIERVARALYEAHGFVKPWQDPDTQRRWKPVCERQAKAVIEAMRDPTATMIEALTGSRPTDTDYNDKEEWWCSPASWTAAYQRMIDASLQGEGETRG